MALQKKFEKISVNVVSQKLYRVGIRGRLWEEGANPATDESIYEHLFYGQYKEVDGSPPVDQMTKMIKKVKEDAQEAIDKFILEKNLLGHQLLADALVWLHEQITT